MRTDMTTILRAAGTYTIRPGYGAVRDCLQRTGDREGTRKAMATLVLVEIEVMGAPGPPDLGNWCPEGIDQVPWDHVYTTLDRSTVIARMYEAPRGGDYAVSFFLHYFDPSKPFRTPWGSVVLSAAQEQRPRHLTDRVYRDPGS